MTLDTRPYVRDPVDRAALFREAQTLIGLRCDPIRTPETQRFTDERFDDRMTLANEPMQGLPAWLMVFYRPDGPLRSPEQAAAHDAYCNVPDGPWHTVSEPLCDPASDHPPDAWVEVSFDTAYGWRGHDGANCGALHAWLIAKLGEWLNAQVPSWCDVHDALEGTCRPDPAAAGHGVPCAASPTRNPRQGGVRWSWLNEYTGVVHQGFDALPGLVGYGDQATAWFDREVLPVLPALAALTNPPTAPEGDHP